MNRALSWVPLLLAICLSIAVSFNSPAIAQTFGSTIRDPEPAPADDYADELPVPTIAPPRNAPPALQPFLGVTLEPQTREAAITRSVSPGSPAEQAGLQPGDIIIGLNGQRVASYQDVLNLVAAMQPGDRVDIDYTRRVSVRTQAVLDGRPVELQRTAGYAPDPAADLVQPANPQWSDEQLPAPPNYRGAPRRPNQPNNVNAAPRRPNGANQNPRASDDDRNRRRADRNRENYERRGFRLLPRFSRGGD